MFDQVTHFRKLETISFYKKPEEHSQNAELGFIQSWLVAHNEI